MFEKVLASFGVGAAKVDTRLESSRITPGDILRGEVYVRGGRVEQQIDDIYLYLVVHYLKNERVVPYILKRYQLSESFMVGPEAHNIIPFEIRIPPETPMSTGRFPAYIKTGLDIKTAFNPTDTDRVQVLPSPSVGRMMEEFEKADFVLYGVDSIYHKEAEPHPFAQLFTFRPSGRYHGFLDELFVTFHVSDREVQMNIEIVRGERSLTSYYRWSLADPESPVLIGDEENDQLAEEGQNPFETVGEFLRRNVSEA